MERLHSVLYSDSQEALKAMGNPGQQSAQFLIRNITKRAAEINKSRTTSRTTCILYQWCSGRAKIPDNEGAHNLSRRATELGREIEQTPASKVLLLASAMRVAKSAKFVKTPDRFYKAKVGKLASLQSRSIKRYPDRTPACYTMRGQNCTPTSCVSYTRV